MRTPDLSKLSVQAKCDWTPVHYFSKPDPHWKFTDAQGHAHKPSLDKLGEVCGYPTLRPVYADENDYFGDPPFSHYECSVCGEVIRPRQLGPGTDKVPGPVEYRRSGWVTLSGAEEIEWARANYAASVREIKFTNSGHTQVYIDEPLTQEQFNACMKEYKERHENS